MKMAYTVILTPVSDDYFSGYAVNIPTLDINTQGESVTDAISMARDAIGMWACFEIDEGRDIPDSVIESGMDIDVPSGSIMAIVDIDIDAYRRAHDNRTVRKNLTIPKWLNDQAESAGVNFSQILQKGLKQELGVFEPDYAINRYSSLAATEKTNSHARKKTNG